MALAKASEVEVKPFVLEAFIGQESRSEREEKVSKKRLKALAKELGLRYSDEELQSAKKLLEAYLAKR